MPRRPRPTRPPAWTFLAVHLVLTLPASASASLCTASGGVISDPADGPPAVCCTSGCGQSRAQCAETDDVCKGTPNPRSLAAILGLDRTAATGQRGRLGHGLSEMIDDGYDAVVADGARPVRMAQILVTHTPAQAATSPTKASGQGGSLSARRAGPPPSEMLQGGKTSAGACLPVLRAPTSAR